MPDYKSNLDLPAAAAWLLQAQTFTLLTHAKPDGDAWGSVVALAAALRSLGKRVTAAFAPPVPASLAELPGHELTLTLDEANDLTELPANVDRVILLDTGAWSQCEPFADYLKAHLARTLIIDHHRSGDVDAKYRYVDPAASATCEILADLFRSLLPTANCLLPLFVGISTDTGFFRFSNTTPRTLRLAADLIEQGVDSASLYEQLEQCERREKLELTRLALDSLRWVAGGCAAVMVLRRDDFERSGALEEESERLVNLPLQVAAARVSALVCEKQGEEGVICRLSLRSKSTGRTVDVSKLAGAFGGGGHLRAAGARVEGNAESVLPQVIAALDRAL